MILRKLFYFATAMGIAGTAGCDKQCRDTHVGPAKPVATATVTPPAAAAASALPWTRELVGNDAECRAADDRLRQGLALEDDYWFAVVCVSAQIQPDRMDAFIEQVHNHRAREDLFVHFLIEEIGHIQGAELDTLHEVQKRVRSTGHDRTTLYLSSQYKAPPQAHLGAGGLRGVCLPWSKTAGHYQVTLDAAKAVNNPKAVPRPVVRFSYSAQLILADASQDPDLFDWTNMAAHGQTPFETKPTSASTEQAKQRWVDFIHAHVMEARKACTATGDKKSVRHALYHLGYALHAVEDVASHRGRTNEEHSYNAYVEHKNPDTDIRSIALATDMATSFLSGVLTTALKDCATDFASYDGEGVSYRDKVTKLGRKLQLTPVELIRYRASREEFEKIKDLPESRVRWFGETSAPERCDDDAGCKALMSMLRQKLEAP